MLPLAFAALGAWLLPPPWPMLAVRLAIIWGAMILIFVAGVRRGFGFGNPRASTGVEIATMLAYFRAGGTGAGRAGRADRADAAVGRLCAGAGTRHACGSGGNAPAHFAQLRWPQMGIAIVSVAALLFYVVRV